ncbi:Glycosyl transferase family 2 [Acetitomaculum ruminis DSM 5522]|uniref:Glycosyl transferase family 2 n=1 Tax=Acetitomaculum ruminis DSM 5522 TaxID=1120918 RepID=A0A1I0Z149_9FIRM|nr:glycosyltransferase family 2 protein [Acetitomaculum ruminis]SFB19355.1 Glycosyl transferase family 2 [Acetitomaculum ruminis DSM 5522]
MEDFVDIIVPIYNVEKYLKSCIESVRKQSYENINIILVDDGSLDKSREICDLEAEKDPRIKVIHKKNGGISSARNAGLKASFSEYFIFVDSDDIIHPNMVEILLKTIKRYNTDMVACEHYRFCEEDEIKINNCDKAINPIIMDNYSCAQKILDFFNLKIILAWNKIYKRRAVEEVAFKEGMLCEDVCFCIDLLKKGLSCTFVDNILYFWRYRKNSISEGKTDKYHMDYLKAYIYIFNNLSDKYSREYKGKLFCKVANSMCSEISSVNKNKKLVYAMRTKIYTFIDKNHNMSKDIPFIERIKIFVLFRRFSFLYIFLKKQVIKLRKCKK